MGVSLKRALYLALIFLVGVASSLTRSSAQKMKAEDVVANTSTPSGVQKPERRLKAASPWELWWSPSELHR